MNIRKHAYPLQVLRRSKKHILSPPHADSAESMFNAVELQRAKTMPLERIAKSSKNEPGLIVSMTSTLPRLETTYLALRSVFQMISQPDRVVLWLDKPAAVAAKKSQHYVPLIESGLSILEVEDVGPLTKIYYALQQFPDSTVVTLDDDIVYPMDALSNLRNVAKVHEGAIIANWARKIEFNKQGVPSPVPKGRLLTPPFGPAEREKPSSTQPSLWTFAYGTGGVLYPPGSLSEQVEDLGLYRKLCPTEDDIWLKAMSFLVGTPVVAAPYGFNPATQSIHAANHTSLRSINHDLGRHHQQLTETFSYFKIKPKFF